MDKFAIDLDQVLDEFEKEEDAVEPTSSLPQGASASTGQYSTSSPYTVSSHTYPASNHTSNVPGTSYTVAHSEWNSNSQVPGSSRPVDPAPAYGSLQQPPQNVYTSASGHFQHQSFQDYSRPSYDFDVPGYAAQHSSVSQHGFAASSGLVTTPVESSQPHSLPGNVSHLTQDISANTYVSPSMTGPDLTGQPASFDNKNQNIASLPSARSLPFFDRSLKKPSSQLPSQQQASGASIHSVSDTNLVNRVPSQDYSYSSLPPPIGQADFGGGGDGMKGKWGLGPASTASVSGYSTNFSSIPSTAVGLGISYPSATNQQNSVTLTDNVNRSLQLPVNAAVTTGGQDAASGSVVPIDPTPSLPANTPSVSKTSRSDSVPTGTVISISKVPYDNPSVSEDSQMRDDATRVESLNTASTFTGTVTHESERSHPEDLSRTTQGLKTVISVDTEQTAAAPGTSSNALPSEENAAVISADSFKDDPYVRDLSFVPSPLTSAPSFTSKDDEGRPRPPHMTKYTAETYLSDLNNRGASRFQVWSQAESEPSGFPHFPSSDSGTDSQTPSTTRTSEPRTESTPLPVSNSELERTGSLASIPSIDSDREVASPTTAPMSAQHEHSDARVMTMEADTLDVAPNAAMSISDAASSTVQQVTQPTNGSLPPDYTSSALPESTVASVAPCVVQSTPEVVPDANSSPIHEVHQPRSSKLARYVADVQKHSKPEGTSFEKQDYSGLGYSTEPMSTLIKKLDSGVSISPPCVVLPVEATHADTIVTNPPHDNPPPYESSASQAVSHAGSSQNSSAPTSPERVNSGLRGIIGSVLTGDAEVSQESQEPALPVVEGKSDDGMTDVEQLMAAVAEDGFDLRDMDEYDLTTSDIPPDASRDHGLDTTGRASTSQDRNGASTTHDLPLSTGSHDQPNMTGYIAPESQDMGTTDPQSVSLTTPSEGNYVKVSESDTFSQPGQQPSAIAAQATGPAAAVSSSVALPQPSPDFDYTNTGARPKQKPLTLGGPPAKGPTALAPTMLEATDEQPPRQGFDSQTNGSTSHPQRPQTLVGLSGSSPRLNVRPNTLLPSPTLAPSPSTGVPDSVPATQPEIPVPTTSIPPPGSAMTDGSAEGLGSARGRRPNSLSLSVPPPPPTSAGTNGVDMTSPDGRAGDDDPSEQDMAVEAVESPETAAQQQYQSPEDAEEMEGEEEQEGEGSSLGLEKPMWVPDVEAPECFGCGIKFTLVRRRHHCRACGKVFCKPCSSDKAKLHYLEGKEARVCTTCHIALSLAEVGRPGQGSSQRGMGRVIADLSARPSRSVLRSQVGGPREAKQVTFSDGARPGVDEGASAPPHPPAAGAARSSELPSLAALREPPLPDLSIYDNVNFDSMMQQFEDADKRPVIVAINKNVFADVSIISLSCCMEKEVWVVRTRGMVKAGQDELLVLLARVADDPDSRRFPLDLLKHLAYIYDQALSGHPLGELDHSIFADDKPFLGNPHAGGLLLIKPSFQCLLEIGKPDDPFLVGVLILKSELTWAAALPVRLMLRLGAEFRYYPCPLLSVNRREPVYTEVGHTIMGVLCDLRSFRYSLVQLPGATIHLEEKLTNVVLPRDAYPQVQQLLSNSEDHVLAFGVSFSLEADSHLVCLQDETGTYHTQAINIQDKPRKVTGASFIVFNGVLKPSGSVQVKSSIVEDGVMMHILPEGMEELRQAMKDMRDYEIVGGGEQQETISVKWRDVPPRVNTGVMSPLDRFDLEPMRSVRIHPPPEYRGSHGRGIRWTELFFLQSPDVSTVSNPVDEMRLAEQLAEAFGRAMSHQTDMLYEEGIIVMSLRISLSPDTLGYQAGSEGQQFPSCLASALDEALLPALSSVQNVSSSLVFELLFRLVYL